MASITKEATHLAYEQAKLFYDQKVSMEEAIADLPISASSVKDYIYNYRQMRNGLSYQRTLNAYSTRYYLNGIYNELGAAALEKALTSLDQHVRYYDALGHGKNREGRKIHTEFSEKLKNVAVSIEQSLKDDILEIEHSPLTPTEKERMINARLGQGQFREDVIRIEKCCRVTGLEHSDLLIASHIKPWSKCDDNENERLNGYNGLLLAPHIDKLFDRGYISFTDSGDMLCSESAKEALRCWNITPCNVGDFHPRQKEFLAWHRRHVFKP